MARRFNRSDGVDAGLTFFGPRTRVARPGRTGAKLRAMGNEQQEQHQQVFTLEAVNALVPRLRAIVGRQLERRPKIEQSLKALSELLGAVPDEITPPTSADPEPVRELKQDLIARIAEYQASWQEVERMGAVLKDPRIGLLDFYGRVEGRLVWLCWKHDEESVTHYHALDEGFSGRKPIGHAIKKRLLN